MRNIDRLIEKIASTVAAHDLGGGAYARWLWQNEKSDRKLGKNEYGCADAMNILYTIGRFPKGDERQAALCALLSLQDPETGLFREETHHYIHTTAHCTAAIELFDEKPLYPQKALAKYFTVEGLYSLLDALDWEGNPWPQSHQGAGIYAVGVLTDSVSLEWQRAYFEKLWRDTDPVYGMSRSGSLADRLTDRYENGKSPTYAHLNGWFHYTFNMEYAKRPQRYPQKLIDTCIALYDRDLLIPTFGKTFNFSEIDWVFVLNRATRQTPYRFAEAKDRLRDFSRKYLDWMESADWEKDENANDLHMLFGAVCCLAELQAALPGEIETTVPLKLVLDRRPFI